MQALPWGATSAGPAKRLTIDDGAQCRAVLTDFGARLVELWLPDRDGGLADVVLGHDAVQDYDTPASRYVGATCGRYGNRIARARFDLAGQTHLLDANESAHQLHGGQGGFDTRPWALTYHSPTSASFQLSSPHGDMGYPGALTAQATYAFTAPARLEITLTARVTGVATVVNLVNHAYYNLSGQGSGPTDDHILTLAADHYLAVDAAMIPQGPPTPVNGTAFDFRTPRRLGAVVPPGGFDHNFCLTPSPPMLPPRSRSRTPSRAAALRCGQISRGCNFTPQATSPPAFPASGGPDWGQGRGLRWKPKAGPTARTAPISPRPPYIRAKPICTAWCSPSPRPKALFPGPTYQRQKDTHQWPP